MDKCNPEPDIIPPVPGDPPDNAIDPEIPVGMTLEHLIDLTGEIEHLNELILLHLDKNGGFAGQAAYFSTVQPVLDLLEVEIRFRCQPGMSKNEMKAIISNWIDEEICALQ